MVVCMSFQSIRGPLALRARPAMALLPLRIFLGVTFVYAGIQKLTDPGFLHHGASTYIGTQLHGFANGTPGGFLLNTFAIPHAELAGVGVALLEIAIGLLVLAGLFTRAAAAAGLALNLVLFLTASWKASPYFLGPDIVFVFAWVPLVLAGADGQPALSHVIEDRARRDALRYGGRAPGRAETRETVTRRRLLGQAAGAVGAATLGIAGISALAKGDYHGTHRLLGATGPPGNGARGGSTAHHVKATHAPKVPSGAVRLGPSNALSPGQAATYGDPADGSPDLLIRQAGGELTAMSAVCTHAGCTVGYQNGQIVCPCHGATYDSHSGAVTGGPAPQGLARKRVIERGGQIYAVPS
jgi:thiosulfate dehydrogenase [quinone] large subunit